MTSNRFFIKQSQFQFPKAVLTGEEHHHLKDVVRIQPDETIWLFDEDGASYLARVEEVLKSETRLLILEKGAPTEQNVRITLAQSFIKTAKMDFIIQKVTEIGVAEFVPVVTTRTMAKLDLRMDKKHIRWERIVREASKQCGRNSLTEITPPQELSLLLKERKDALKLYLNLNSDRYLKDILIQFANEKVSCPPESVVVLVGPEGGWTDDEERDILRHDFEAVNIGFYTLRSETAAITSTAMIAHFWNQ